MYRQVVDFELARRSKLAQVRSGRIGLDQVCDADPGLLRAAQFHGTGSQRSCPVCRKEPLTEVCWVFGHSLGRSSGSARTPTEISRLDGHLGEFTVQVVEVCRTCHWNHLLRSFVAGTSAPPVARRRAVT